MTVPSSIFNSDNPVPTGKWPQVWVSIFLILIFIILFLELTLQSRGWTPSLTDTKDLWAAQRQKASALGNEAIILVGASRIQLGIDLDVLDQMTGRQTIQLAIDGNSFLPVMADLANDIQITGTIIVSANTPGMLPYTNSDRAREWLDHYRELSSEGFNPEPYRVINNRIKMLLGNYMVTRLYGAKPYTVLSRLLVTSNTSGNYMSIDTRRSIDADYTKVIMPDFYFERVRRNFGSHLLEGQVTYDQFLSTYQDAISAMTPVSNEPFMIAAAELAGYIDSIESRGGSVILVHFPADKLVWAMETRQYPRSLFWNQLEEIHDKTVHFMDHPGLSGFDLPDGAHLDYRDKAGYTRELTRIITQNNWLN